MKEVRTPREVVTAENLSLMRIKKKRRREFLPS